jgi:hypothetical protein
MLNAATPRSIPTNPGQPISTMRPNVTLHPRDGYNIDKSFFAGNGYEDDSGQ